MRIGLNLLKIILFIICAIFDAIQSFKDPFDFMKNYYQRIYGKKPIRWQNLNLKKYLPKSLEKNPQRLKKKRTISYQTTIK